MLAFLACLCPVSGCPSRLHAGWAAMLARGPELAGGFLGAKETVGEPVRVEHPSRREDISVCPPG